MKKILLVSLLIGTLLLTGCGKASDKSVVKDLGKKVSNSKSYHLEGELEIINNEDSYKYDVEVSYEKPDSFRVSLKNKVNNHEQIILKNTDGVYVLTPSLNKSFKFQSDWPYNNSQAYLLQTIVKDLKNDDKRTFEEKNNQYILTSKVNYSNNTDLVKQVVYMDKKLNIQEVHVLNSEGVPQIKMKVNNVDMKATFDKKYFVLKDNMASAIVNDTTAPVSKIEEVIFPMYMPESTRLQKQDKINKEDGERIILTFAGDKPFMLIQETATKEEELTTIPMYGEPDILIDTVAAISDTSITWVSNGIEYYLVSDVLEKNELLSVAKSIGVMPVAK